MSEMTSIKQLIQGMQRDSIDIITGTVKSVMPLQIGLTNDQKMIINANMVTVPQYLKAYTQNADLEFDWPDLPAHASVKIRYDNSLKVNDSVVMLSYNYGKNYFILDREA